MYNGKKVYMWMMSEGIHLLLEAVAVFWNAMKPAERGRGGEGVPSSSFHFFRATVTADLRTRSAQHDGNGGSLSDDTGAHHRL